MSTRPSEPAAAPEDGVTVAPLFADLLAADAAAVRALAGITEASDSQLGALHALTELVTLCERAGAAVLTREVLRLLQERKQAFRAFHLGRVQQRLDHRALAGAGADDDTRAALLAALAVMTAIDGADSGTVRTLTIQLDDVTRGNPGKPRPFFARYLEAQKR